MFFLFIHMLMGKVVRPASPDAEKLTIYECGEPTVGSAWIQFDLRYYVVALLFVIFDVEVAFFFPWAVVFGSVNDAVCCPDDRTRTDERDKRLDARCRPIATRQVSAGCLGEESLNTITQAGQVVGLAGV